MTDRREFLKRAMISSGAMAMVPFARGLGSLEYSLAPKPLNILILGGTGLTGPFQVKYALSRGHTVTVFNRGKRNDKLPSGVTELIGDRNLHQLDALKGKDWDVVIDNPTTLPFWVRDAGEVLKDHTKQYVFISTISVYKTAGLKTVEESSPQLEYTEGDPMTVTMQQVMKNIELMYGAMKTASEREATKWFGNRTTIIRPTLIAGPGDDSFRFTYWPARIAKGGEVLAPGDGKDNVQMIDARDLAEWTIRVVEDGTKGTFNAAGPKIPMTIGQQLDTIKGAVPGGKDAKLTWVPTDFLTAQKVSPWGDMPTWIPRSDPDYASANADNRKAVAAGLTFRPVAVTAVDALEWFNAAPEQARAQMMKGAGIDPEREKAVLAAWHAKK